MRFNLTDSIWSFKPTEQYHLQNLSDMQTIRLKVNEKVYDQLLGLLAKFSKDDIEIINESDISETKKYLEAELEEIKNGKANFLTVNEAEQRMDDLIKKHEDHL